MQRPKNSQATPKQDDRLYTSLIIRPSQIKWHNISTNTLMDWRNGEDPERITEIHSMHGIDWSLLQGRRTPQSARSVATQKDPSSHSHRHLPQEVKHNTGRKAKLKSII